MNTATATTFNHLPEPPAGYMRRANGDLTPTDNVPEIDITRDSVIYPLVGIAKDISAMLDQLKEQALQDMAAFVALAAEAHGVKLGGAMGNVTLTTFDGQYRMERVNAKIIRPNESVLAAQALFEESLATMSEGANKNLRTVVMLAFKKNRNNELRMDRLIELMNAPVDEPSWAKACEVLRSSLYVAGTATYVRFYERVGMTDKYKLINLTFAGADA